MDSQEKRVYAYMQKYGCITRIQAMLDLGVANLPARITNLRRSGVDIITDMVDGNNRYGEKCRHAEYRIKKEESTPLG